MSDTADRTSHWQAVYSSKSEQDVSWFEESPLTSRGLIDAVWDDRPAALIDIGGGASRLADVLLERPGFSVSVLDVSSAALEAAKKRIGVRSSEIDWIVADITRWQPSRAYDIWHDRAALHFLTEKADQRAYMRALRRALRSGGAAIIGTFAPDGPERCSGLSVVRHDADSLARLLGSGFELLDSRRHDHTTPWGAIQKFQFSTFRRVD